MLGALLSFAGGLISSAISAQSASDNRSFQERMSSTSHQREVRDLRKAGLNPVLSALHGHGASTPGGDSFQMSNPADASVYAYLQERRLDEVEVPKAKAEIAGTASNIALNEKTGRAVEQNTATGRAQELLNLATAEYNAINSAYAASKIELTALEKDTERYRALESKNRAIQATAQTQKILSEIMGNKATLPRKQFFGRLFENMNKSLNYLSDRFSIKPNPKYRKTSPSMEDIKKRRWFN